MSGRWPLKPLKGGRCDCHVGTTFGPHGEPKAIPCPNEAVETVRWTVGVMPEGWVCISCAESLADRGVAVRNPRIFGKRPRTEAPR